LASHNPHSPWTLGDRSRYDAAKLRLPPGWPDTTETRDDLRNYLAECTVLDGEVATALALLKETGADKNTVVVFLSEQGTSQPRAKWNLYDRGIQSACIVRWPGVIRAATTTAALVEYVDILPTFLEIAGAPRTSDLDGRSFLPVLRGEATSHKEFVFAEYTNRGVNNGSDHYGIRSVRSARYKYIWNFTPRDPYANASMNNETYRSWTRAAAAGDATAQTAIARYLHRAEVEFYDVTADPEEFHNLADDPKLAGELVRHRAQLDAWMKEQGDLGQVTEMEALKHMTRYVEDPGGAAKQKKEGKK
ncbi:MAG: sulfatase/phosphatase domain-containing protein, partial [Opitutaceae bacterium]